MNGPWDVVYLPLGAAAFGGAERSILELAAAQQAAGRRVVVCHEPALAGTDFSQAAAARGVPLQTVDWAPERPLAEVACAAWRFFGGLDARIVHFNISWRQRMWCVPLIARMASRARLVGTMRAMPERFSDLPHRTYLGFIPGPRVFAWPDYLIGRVWARALHSTVSVNRDDYPPRLVRAFGFEQRRLSVVYNGVQVPARLPTAAERRAARRGLGLDEDEFVVAYVGRVSPEKGVRHLVEGFLDCASPARLLVAGDGADLEPMRALAAELGVASRTVFMGYVSDPVPVYLAADVLVVPSLWNEAFGRVVVEGMARGAVVVATTVGGMQEIFKDGSQGLHVPRADSPAIGRALRRLQSDRAELVRLSVAGFEHARSTFSVDRVCQQYSDLYAELA